MSINSSTPVVPSAGRQIRSHALRTVPRMPVILLLKTALLCGLLLFAGQPSHSVCLADTFELTNGTVITCVIISETPDSFTVQTEIGKITIDKETISKHVRQSDEINAELRRRWKEAKRRYKRSVSGNPFTKVENGRRMVKYNGSWITFDEYSALQKKLQDEQEEFVETEKEEDKKAKQEKVFSDNQARTFELIQQGRPQRSRRLQSVLDKGTWYSAGTDNFIIYYAKKNQLRLAESLAEAAEYYFDAILRDFGFDISFSFQERVEILFVDDTQTWQTVAADDLRSGIRASLSSHYFKEILLRVNVSKKTTVNHLAHELTRMMVEEHILQNFSKRHQIPLWLMEGLSGFQGEMSHLILPPETVVDALRKNYLIRLDDLLTMREYPEDELERKLFYIESRSLIDYIFSRYGKQNMRLYIDSIVSLYHEIISSDLDYTTENTRHVIKRLVEETFLSRDFSGFSSFEENWLRYLLETYQMKKRQQELKRQIS